MHVEWYYACYLELYQMHNELPIYIMYYIELVCPISIPNDRLLYFMLMRYRNCGHCLPADELSLDYIIYTLCALIQHERNLIIEMDIPNALRDLFLEQSKIDTLSWQPKCWLN